MGVVKDTQDKFLEVIQYYGGSCDCEIILNAKLQSLERLIHFPQSNQSI